MVNYRQIEEYEMERLLDLIEVGFAYTKREPDWNYGRLHRIIFDYLYQEAKWQPNQVRVAEEAGELLAAVGFFPQALELEGIIVKAGAISPVVTAPTARGGGLARHCISAVEAELCRQEFPLAFLWGLPEYYPRLGYVPLLPRYKTKLNVIGELDFTLSQNVTLREVRNEDCAPIAALYATDPVRWLKPVRNLAWWQARFMELDQPYGWEREYPFIKREHFLVGEVAGAVVGYCYLKFEENLKRVTVLEGTAINLEAAFNLVKLLLKERLPTDWELDLRGTPEHFLNMAAAHLGGIHLAPAPRAGMIKILNWQQFLKRILPLLQRRVTVDWLLMITEKLFEIHDYTGRLVLRVLLDDTLCESALTRVIFGLYDATDLSLLQLEWDDAMVLFPKRAPFIWDQNYIY